MYIRRLAMAQELWEKAFSTLLKVISKEHSGVSCACRTTAVFEQDYLL